MKKGLILPLVATVATLVLANTAMAASTGDGTIHFKGEIIDSPCVVSTDSQNQEINLGQVKSSSFTAKGVKSPTKAFQIKLEECNLSKDSPTKVSVAFSGVGDATDNTLASVANEAGSAAGVAIGIYDNANKPVALNNTTATAATALTTGQTVMYYSANYVSTGATVTPGYANADVDFNVVYQ